jgi:4-diphosphocytidyl-2-C-methyl-D-erythritol kinase
VTGARTLSPAKLNLGLEILGKRADGFHEIRTVMQAISLCDELTIVPSSRNRIRSSQRGLSHPGNLAVKAADLWRDSLDPQRRAMAITLRKSIPVAAGLGGASSNAATLLRLASQLFGAVEPARLHDAAAALGSDVPFFLASTTAIARGRGELLESLPPVADLGFVLVTPKIDIPRKTATMYGLLNADDFSDGSATETFATRIRAGKGVEAGDLHNSFARPLLQYAPDLERIPTIMRSFAGQRVGLSGAGPTWYAVVDGLEEARDLAERLRAALPATRVETAQALADLPAIELLDDRNDDGSPRV